MTELTKTGVVLSDQDDRARRAVKAFRALQPTLTAYARILTKRRNVRVEMAASDNGSTDGTKIFFRPPLALGDKTGHERRLCDRRDENLQQLCPACKVREKVLVTIYHEIGHICYDSFAEPDADDLAKTFSKLLGDHGSKYADRVKTKFDSAPAYRKRSFKGISEIISPYLPIIINALEDARVNSATFKARTGTKIMFEADDREIFTKGVEQRDPTTGQMRHIKWSEYPLNAQITVGLFCKASGYDYTGYFADEIMKALGDEQLTELVNRVHTTRTAAGVYHLSFPVLARLRELGYCKADTDPEPEPEPEPEDNEEQQSDEPDEPQSGDEEGKPDESGEEDDGGEDSDAQPQFDSTSGSGDPDEPREGEDAESSDSGSEDSAPSDADSDSVQSDEPDESEGVSNPSDRSSEDEQADPDGASGEEEAHEQQVGSDDRDSRKEDPDGRDDQQDTNSGDDADQNAGRDEGDPDSSTGESQRSEASDDPEEGGTSEQDSNQHGDADPDSHADEPSNPSQGGGGSPDDGRGEDLNEGEDSQDAGATESPVEQDTAPDPTDEPDSDGGPQDGEAHDEGDSRIDTGADEGRGGTQLIEDEDDVPLGTHEDALSALQVWTDHEEKPDHIKAKIGHEEAAIDKAIIQGTYFETPSQNIYGVREHQYGNPIMDGRHNMSGAWDNDKWRAIGFYKALGIDGDFDAPESILGPALLRMRVAFSDNRRGKELRHLKGGKVDGKVIGKRAFHGDERMFRRRIMPGKKDYFVLIGMDVSGSTIGENLFLEKKAVMAQAQLLSRMGIKFAIYAHSGNFHSAENRYAGIDLDMYLVKQADEPWSAATQERLKSLGPDSANLDGHALEYYRKVLDREQATDKIILYYSDGKMPAENHDEELEILQREIRVCKQRGYLLLGVGIRTDSPSRHGLDTVEVNGEEDVVKVVKHIEKRLMPR